MKPATIKAIFALFEKRNPNPQGELNHQNPFELLVAVVLSAQATDISVNKATARLYAVANTPATMAALGVEGVKPYIKTIGLFNNKAKHIIALCEILMRDYDSQVPDSLAALEKLPGVGRKTANVVLNMAFGQPTIAVDTHVYRVSRRLGLTQSKTVLAVEKDLLACIPKRYLMHAHHWLILHGRYICQARRPVCESCFLSDYCQYFAQEHSA
jgi:endonuclease-3